MGNNHMRRILVCFLLLLIAPFAHAAEMVNVEYIHSAITGRWGITLPYNSALDNPHVAANMKYLLTAIDRANEILNGESITDYGNDTQYATLAAADTIAATNAIDNLIIRGPFIMTTTPNTTNFKFDISAQGRFLIDWGDGTPMQVLRRNNTENETLSHTYTRANAYTIKLYGRATDYNNEWANTAPTPSITFANNTNLAGIDGNLGHIFPTIDTNHYPRFYRTFYQCTNLSSTIPEDLFAGVYGYGYFNETFRGCEKLSGQIPSRLFRGITINHYRAFYYTFSDCKSLTGPIPEDLFSGITELHGATFMGTFTNCTGLSGTIPEKLFSRIHSGTQDWEFGYTFRGCTGLEGYVPAGLFAGITENPTSSAFFDTFTHTNLMTQCPENTPTAPRPDGANWTAAVCGTPCASNETLIDNVCVSNK